MSESRTTVYLLRHGRTAHNREGIFRGRLDVPLDTVGRLQAAAAGDALRPVALAGLYTSPLSRALQTARALETGRAVAAVVDEAFSNLDLGPWTGRRRSDVAREQPDLWRIWTTRPEDLRLEGAETLDAVADRAAAGLDRLRDRHRGAIVAVVTHRAVIKPLLARVLGLAAPWFWKLSVEPASISVLTHHPVQGYTLEALNRTGHLPREALGSRDDA